jgi:hypothetical protein
VATSSSGTLRVDDPVFPAEVGSAGPDVHGVRDLYLVFSAPGVTGTLTFR